MSRAREQAEIVAKAAMAGGAERDVARSRFLTVRA
jgi:hypothetical protein